MPVPSSYNDITQKREIRDYLGWAWYDRQFFVPQVWKTEDLKMILRFGSVHYNAVVFVNGINVVNHTGGHLPFEADITSVLNFDKENLLTVVVNNTLTRHTVPQGSVDYKKDSKLWPENFYEVTVPFDFFNYAGIHRSVQLYAVPKTYINDITVTTDINGSNGLVNYTVELKGDSKAKLSVKVYDKNGNFIKQQDGQSGTVTIPNATLWWPFLMDENPGYLYTFNFILHDGNQTVDSYFLKVGIRTVKIESFQFLINGKKFYFKGFGKHEDIDVSLKDLNFVVNN